jgi:hypothetical protein
MEWIASRTFTDDSGKEVTVALGAPYAVGVDEWACPYDVSGLSPAQVRHARGIDAFQAILMALDAIYRLLDASPNALSWKGGDPGDTGIPRLPTMAWGLPLRRHIENVMNMEEEFWQSWLTAHFNKRKP